MPAANPDQGEVPFNVEGGQSYALKFSIPAVIALEDLLDKPVAEVMVGVARGRVGYIRAALAAGLRDFHPKVTTADISDFMMKIEGGALAPVLKAMQLAFPSKEEAAGEGDGDPQSEDPSGSEADPSSKAGAS